MTERPVSSSLRVMLSCIVIQLFGTMLLPAQDDVTQKRIESLEARLSKIEARLLRIENVLFASIKYSESEARRQLNEAKEAMAYNQRLHAQGLVSAPQLELDRMAINRASTLLKMCQQKEDNRMIGATLDVLDAKQALERQQINLKQNQRLLSKGFINREQVARDKAAILLAQEKLKVAEAKLQEMKKVVNSSTPDKDK